MSLTRIERRRGQQLTTRVVIGIFFVLAVFATWVGASLWAYFNLPVSGAYSYGQSAATRQALGDFTDIDELRTSVMNKLASDGEWMYEGRLIFGGVLIFITVVIGAMMYTLNKPSKEFELS